MCSSFVFPGTFMAIAINRAALLRVVAGQDFVLLLQPCDLVVVLRCANNVLDDSIACTYVIILVRLDVNVVLG